MAVSGTWVQRAARDYTGATKWGTGVDPIHAVRDQGRGRTIGAKTTLLPLGEPSDVVSEQLTGRELDWLAAEYVDPGPTAGEMFRYQDERPTWASVPEDFRGLSTSPAMGESISWGVYGDANRYDGFPLPGPSGGMMRSIDVDHGERIEQQHAIAVPTQPTIPGWRNKWRGLPAEPDGNQTPGQPGYQLAINTYPQQGPGKKSSDNTRAVERGTDAPRSAIESRTAGARIRGYAQSFGMSGAPGTPDMRPYQQTVGMKRPFFYRTAGTAPAEQHTYNTMEGRIPMFRVMPPDPYQGDLESGGTLVDVAPDWGY
jgi:hypothetical protein